MKCCVLLTFNISPLCTCCRSSTVFPTMIHFDISNALQALQQNQYQEANYQDHRQAQKYINSECRWNCGVQNYFCFLFTLGVAYVCLCAYMYMCSWLCVFYEYVLNPYMLAQNLMFFYRQLIKLLKTQTNKKVVFHFTNFKFILR